MKKIYTLALLIFTALSYGQVTELYFSKYGEGSSNNKFIEIYNGTTADISLDNYAFPNVSNAPSTVGEYEFWNTFPDGAVVTAGDVYVIAHPSADAAILAAADMTFNYLSNGDDGFALVYGTETDYSVLDWLGDWQGDPGSGWEVAGVADGTKDHTLTRKSSVCGPNNNWTAAAGTNASDSEWIVGAQNSGWDTLGSYSGCVSGPTLTITAPSDGEVLASGSTSATISVSVDNFVVDEMGGSGDGHIHWTLNGADQPMKYNTEDENITVSDGETYTVYMELVDNTHMAISPAVNQTISFSVSFPCDLQVGDISTTCDDNTSGVDTYTTLIDFTGGGSSQYTISTTADVGVIGGDDPSQASSGTISITGVNEGTSYTLTFAGDATNSSCNFTRSINSPSCVGNVSCANPGDIIITEVMQNPAAVSDNNGEYFEVYNTTASAIDMQGWEIQDDLSTSETHTISNLSVPANGYAVLAINADTSTNGGLSADYQYTNISLGNGTDGLVLKCGEAIIDAVTWDDGTTFPDPVGVSMELATEAYNSTDNDNGANWGEATTAFGAGDLGSPGQENSYTLSSQNLAVTSFSLSPNPAQNLVYITTAQSGIVQVKVFDLLGKKVLQHTLEQNGNLDISSLKTGVYLVKLQQNNSISTKRLVVK